MVHNVVYNSYTYGRRALKVMDFMSFYPENPRIPNLVALE